MLGKRVILFLEPLKKNSSSLREIDPEDTMNIDETLILLGYSNGHTYEREGQNTVSMKSDRSG